jgi:acyl carrier protein
MIMLEQITQILKDYKSDDSLVVAEDTTFESLELDSLDLTQLVMDIEDAFGVTIEMDSPITTVAELMEIIKKAQA